MRPVDKGDCPEDSGIPIEFPEYTHARPYLIERLGQYCSYCESRLPASLAVEHKAPKSILENRGLDKDWSNFLLACVNCNSVKGHAEIDPIDYVWPDIENTLFAFTYGPGALIQPNSNLIGDERRRAQKTIALLGLDRLAGDVKAMSDRRWMNRQEAWGLATRMLANLNRNDTEELRDAIAVNAKFAGFYSVWYTVFEHDIDMLERIYNEYVGTCKQCFDAQYRCVPRLMRI